MALQHHPTGDPRKSIHMPPIGLGTWRMGEREAQREREVAAIRHAIELGYRLIDTAEMYGEGGAERIVGRAVAEALRAGDVERESLFIVSKVYPHHASREGVEAACRRSLGRLGLDTLDLYLLHWRGQHPLAQTVAGFEQLRADKLIGRWGVSNFDVADMNELLRIDAGRRCATNQIYLSLSERGAEHSLLRWLEARKITAMAYSPIDQGALASARALDPIAERHQATPAQIALAWLLSRSGVVPVPKALQPRHLSENLAAQRLRLTTQDLEEIDSIFPRPTCKVPLAMI